MQTTTTASSSRISALAAYYEGLFPQATPQEILNYVTAAIPQQQQPQPIQAQNQYQAQPLPTQQTQPTQGYFANTYVNQTPQTYYNSGNYTFHQD